MFEYHTQMAASRALDPDVRLHQTARGWAEPTPSHCPDCGAALGPRKVLVGLVQCRCGRSHRTHFCRHCESTQYSPRLGEDCLLLAMDERNMRATLRADRNEGQAQE